MKKILCALLAVLMLLTLCACGGDKNEPADNNDTPAVTPDVTETGYVFEDNGVKIEIGAPISAVDALGTPVDTFEEASCAFEGKDVTNFYSNYEILLAYPNEGDSYIYSVIITSDAIATPEGLEVGMTTEDVTSIYGETEPQGGLYVYAKGNMTLRVLTVDGVVDSIEYKIAE